MSHEHVWSEWTKLIRAELIRRCDCGAFQVAACHGEPVGGHPCALCQTHHMKGRWRNIPLRKEVS